MATRITPKKRLVVYLTNAEYKAAAARAKKEKRSLSAFTSYALNLYLTDRKADSL